MAKHFLFSCMVLIFVFTSFVWYFFGIEIAKGFGKIVFIHCAVFCVIVLLVEKVSNNFTKI